MNIREINEAIDKALYEDFPKSLTDGYSQADISSQGNYKHFNWNGDGIAYQLEQNNDLYSFHITCLPQGSFTFCEETPVNYLLTVWKGDFHSGEALLEESITSDSVEEAHKELMGKLHSLNINVNDITVEDLQKIYKEPDESYQKRMKDLRNSMRKADNKDEAGITESLNSEKKTMKESHSFTKDELANNRFVKLYQKCYEYRKEHPEMEAYEIANKLCFNENEGWVNTDEIAQTWADMFVYDGAKDEDLIQKIREDIIEMIEEYLLDDEQDGDFE